MDNKTLITIVITAIIAAFVKEIVAGLISLTKKIFKDKAIAAKLKKVITPNKITTGANLILLGFTIWELSKRISDPSPVTRWVVFDIAFFLCIATLCVYRIEVAGNRYFEELGRRQREQAELNAAKDALKVEVATLRESLKETSEILSERREKKTLTEAADNKKTDSEK